MKNIIVADDHSFIRLGISFLLKDYFPSCKVIEVNDAESLISQIVSHHFDLVISDIEMPGRDGLETLQQIKSIYPGLPVIMISSYSEDLYAVRSFRLGASAYINKTAANDELINAIEHIRLGKRYFTPQIAETLLASIEQEQAPHNRFSLREFMVFKLLASGNSVSQIASQLFLAITTVSTYKRRIFEKLNISRDIELIHYAMTQKIIKTDKFIS
ncbi:response regulator [Foetidibacter luteolus]|uniref:response regulator n=1 Tax=Foetidibacter luteolus TaxID=2608880 RepID=UPI00129B1210|nr:response regulator transcription factor [Foetidibacter luteolus]